jgi:hypothetical protein
VASEDLHKLYSRVTGCSNDGNFDLFQLSFSFSFLRMNKYTIFRIDMQEDTVRLRAFDAQVKSYVTAHLDSESILFRIFRQGRTFYGLHMRHCRSTECR